MKKGQIAIFILLGLIILIAAGFIFYINSQSKVKESEIEQVLDYPFELQSVNQFIESCIKSTGKEAVLFISEHGGYYNLPNPYYSDFFLNIPYYFYENLPLNPSKEEIERQINAYMDENLFSCFRYFTDFREIGYDINFGEINTKTKILSNKLIFDLNMAITLRKDALIQNLENFKVELENIGLDKIIKMNNLIIKEQVKDPSSICISCILNWTEYFDLEIRMNRLNDTIILFTVIDNNTIIELNPLQFNFVNNYELLSCENLPSDNPEFLQQCLEQQIQSLTPELKIQEIPDFTVKVGEQFFYDVNASGKNFVFEDFTELFNINPINGIINFIPKDDNIGEHVIWIKVKDILKQEDYANFRINITK